MNKTSVVLLLCLAFSSTLSIAATNAFDLRSSSPRFNDTVDIPYQTAYRNIRWGLLKCLKLSSFTSALYPDLGKGDVVVLLSGHPRSAGAVFSVATTHNQTHITVWSSSNYTHHFADAAPALATEGESIDCSAHGLTRF